MTTGDYRRISVDVDDAGNVVGGSIRWLRSWSLVEQFVDAVAPFDSPADVFYRLLDRTPAQRTLFER